MIIPHATFRDPEYAIVPLPDGVDGMRLLYRIRSKLDCSSLPEISNHGDYVGVALAEVYSATFDPNKSYLLSPFVRVEGRTVEFRGRAKAMFDRLSSKFEIFRRAETLREVLTIYLASLQGEKD